MTGFLSVFTVLLLFSSAEAQALSCAPPQFDATAIEGLGIIFEGIVEKEEASTLWERIKNKIKDEDYKATSTYTFKITRLWKGEPVKNERVEIIASPGWAQQTAYQIGKIYMVFGESGDKPGTYKASPGWCGFDILPKDQVMKVLEQYHSEKKQSIDKE